MKDEWSRTASLMAFVANTQRDPKKTRAFRPGDFDPFVKSSKPPTVGVEILKDVFLHGRIPKQEAHT